MIVGAVGIGLGRLAILLHQVANDVPALAEQTEESRNELHLDLVAVGCAIMETDSIVLVNGADDVVEVLCILWSLLQHHLIVVFQFVTKRSHAQGAEQPFRNLSVSITVTTAELLAVDIARRISPVVTNFLYRHAATLQLAYQPTIKLCPVVHNLII